jgi:general secretion pathway protein G
MSRRRGFTLIEMLLVMAILGILAAAARPLLELQAQRSREQALRHALRSVRTAIDAYHQAALAGQVARSVGDSGYPPTLEALVQGVPDLRSPADKRLFFLRRLPRDPFADPALPAGQTWALRSADSPPDAPQAGKDVFDILSTSERKALDGSRYRDW